MKIKKTQGLYVLVTCFLWEVFNILVGFVIALSTVMFLYYTFYL